MNIKQLSVAGLSLLLLAACNKKPEDKPAGMPATQVTTATSELRQMELVEESVGALESLADPVVAAEVAGRVAEVRVGAGSAVKAGQVLAVLDTRDVSLSRQAARAEVNRVESLAINHSRNLQRQKQLREQNFISQTVLDDAVAQNAVLQNQLAGARAQLALAERNVGKATINSPIEGSVDRQIVVPGQYVKLGDPAFQVVSLKKLRARLSFPETLSSQVKRGMAVRLTSAGEATQLVGKIAEVRPMTGSGNRAFDVFVMFDNPGGWRPGGSVTGAVVLDVREKAVSVPEQSVILRPQGKVVYVVRDGKAQQRLVQVGISENGWTEITGGLQAEEAVVMDGAGFLTDGAVVKVTNAPPASAKP